MLGLNLGEWLAVAGIISGIAALVALLKDGRSLFRRKEAPSADPIEQRFAEVERTRASVLPTVGAAAAGAMAAEILHRRHGGRGGSDGESVQDSDADAVGAVDDVPDADDALDGATLIGDAANVLRSLLQR